MDKFHPAMKSKQTELEYLRSVMNIIMKTSFPNEAYKCDAARELLLEILSQNILKSLVDLFSDTFWLHKVIVLILSDDVVEVIDDNSMATEDINVQNESVIQSNEEPVPMECATDKNTGDTNNTSAQLELCADLSISSNEVESDQSNVSENESVKPGKNVTSTLDVERDAELEESISVHDFRPTFFVGDFDTISNHSSESDVPDTSQRVAPEGCSPPKDLNSTSNIPLPPPVTAFQSIEEEEGGGGGGFSKRFTPEASSADDGERKEIYRIRNKKWNPEEDRIMPSPLILLTDGSTYQETVDISNAETSVPSVYSAPNFQTLKIDYGPDISNIDPAALIKETPRILFAGVHIPETKMAREPGTASHYTLYCVEVSTNSYP